MRQPQRPQPAIEPSQVGLFRRGQRSPPGPGGQQDDRVQVNRLTFDQALAKCGSPFLERLFESLEDPLLRMIDRGLQQGIQHVDHPERLATDATQFVPQLVKLGLLRLVEHQSRQVVVLAIEQRQRQRFVDRHNLRITQGRREQSAMVGQSGFEPASGLTLRCDENRVAIRDHTFVGTDIDS